ESIEFLLAANPGEPAAPLSKVASGGEAARIMLAVRGVLAASDRGRTLVFDEVDAGVGGRLGPAVAGRLRDLGEGNQVLCITHLPSIAAAAHLHQRVAKEVRAGRTVTIFDELSRKGAEAERVSELADMIAGGAKEKTARAEAGRLLKSFA
ncbi:MAG: DNA repair protein RecN (Recombination protein N), partial [Gammaproteobacteria bacterium]